MTHYYDVRGRQFTNKVEALRYASTLPNCKLYDVKFHYHHSVWANYKQPLGLTPLKELYRQRAQQIRDSYDYLVLYFSGGADSTNILYTFLENNIPLEEVVVKWPKKVIGSSLYTPNTTDQSARNFVSEWDLVIEKELQYLRSNYPKIKITILDYVDDIPKNYYNEDTFLKQNHMHSAVNLLRMQMFTDMEHDPRGKRVCAITGLDKPLLAEMNGKAYMFFSDDIVSLSTKTPESYREDFYWTPEFPQLAYEMAYNVYLYFKHTPNVQGFFPKLIWSYENDQIKHDGFQYYFRLIKPVIYGDTWDMRKFQADKPFQGFKADKDFWFYESGEFDHVIDQWRYHYDSQLSAVDSKFCIVDKNGTKTGYQQIISPLYELGPFNRSSQI
jgi:hypothetical protein